MNYIEYLYKKEYLNKDIYIKLKEIKENNNINIINYILKYKIMNKELIKETLKAFNNIIYYNINKLEYNEKDFKFYDIYIIEKYNILVIEQTESKIEIVVDDPFNYLLEEDLKLLSKNKIIVKKFSFSEEIKNKIKEFKNKENRKITLKNSNTIEIVSIIINNALNNKASDIHLEPFSKKIKIRYRIDGELEEILNNFTKTDYENIVSRIKILSNLNPAEKRKSQDGRISGYILNNIKYDIRVSTMCTIFGEKIVLRILQDKSKINELTKLGFNQNEEKSIKNIISKSNGILLVTGETGSGKTTTLYTILNILNSNKVNICTIEDPVESVIEGINQVQLNNLAGITFTSALKTFLRQDPNIIMVGEIRDLDTAKIAVQSSLTGHLVLSTVHTNNSIATLNRLEEMGIPKYQLLDALKGIISQKLIKTLCPYCKKQHKLNIKEINYIKDIEKRFNYEILNKNYIFYEGEGCSECNYKGYKDRLVVAEILEITDTIIEQLNNNLNINDIRKLLYKDNLFIPIEINAINKCIEGITSISEISSKISL